MHAEGQVANVQLEKQITAEKLRAAINANVGKDVRVLEVQTVDDEFHARYSALEKTYVYRIVSGPVISPFWLRYAHHDARAFDVERMSRCTELFVGTHDWTAFSSAQSDSETKERTITRLNVTSRWDDRGRCALIEMSVSADGFLRYMVRSIAGTLMAVGRGELINESVARLIDKGERSLAAATAPARGLTLQHVSYGDGANPADFSNGTRKGPRDPLKLKEPKINNA